MRTEKYTVDRIENGILVMIHSEDESELCAEKSLSKEKISDGDIVYVSFGENNRITKITVDIEETEQRKKELKSKLKSLFDN